MQSIADRIANDPDRRILVDLLLQQHLIMGNESVAQALSSVSKVIDLPTGEILIQQGDADNDIYFMLSGRVRILVNKRDIATRIVGQHIGEMALIDASSRRTATIVACDPTTVAKVSEADFVTVANAHPFLWRNIAIELVRRLNERRKFHNSPNTVPVLFIGSSREGLAIAQSLARQIPAHIASVQLWSEGVFGASHFPIEDLAMLLECSDYAALFATADDSITSRGKEALAPRDNIVFELGLFMGTLSRHRTFLVIPRGVDIKIPTDILGINAVYYNPSASSPEDASRPAADEIIAIIQKNGPR